MVIKKDGRREQFLREKVQAGLVRACEKRPVSMEEITKVLESIEFKLHEMGLKEIQSRDIGEFVMDALKELDHVAYVRFASVYREFSDINQFAEALKLLKSSSR
jgi:transcriptional repressor NrdR